MKRKLYDSITFEDIKRVYLRQIRVNTKNKVKIRKFEDFYSVNLARVKKIINDKNYMPSKYNIFLIKEPKYRIIMSQNISDKLINHVVADKILLPVLDKCLIDTNVATRKNKETHYGIRYLKKYLNELDHFIKEKLHIKYYIRYMDDGLLLSSDKKYLKYCLKKIEEMVSKYKLKLNKKTKIINVSKEGIDFLGFRFYIWNNKIIMKVRKDTKKRFKKK